MNDDDVDDVDDVDVVLTDVDECAVGSHTCDDKAECYNTIGSFKCVCTSGFSGTGHRCLGTYTSYC